MWAPVKIPYMWLVAIVMAIAFGGALSLSRVLWKSAYSTSNMKQKPIPKQARTWIEALFCWFQVLRQQSMFLSFRMRFLSFFFQYPLICRHVMSCHFPFMFLQRAIVSIHLPFIRINSHAISVHFVLMSFHFFSKVLETALWLGQGAECNKWLSLDFR